MNPIIPIAEFRQRNQQEWKALVDQLFPQGRPTRHVWTDEATICATLAHIGSVPSSNYTFFPGMGGLDLTGCQLAAEAELLELSFQQKPHTSVYYAKASSLVFESLGDPNNYEWDYFWLQLDSLPPTGIGYVRGDTEERLTELGPGQYVSLDKWEYGEPGDLPATTRPVTRLLQGSLVIFQKTSVYNSDISSATGEHSRYTEEGFREEIARLRVEGGRHPAPDSAGWR